MTALDSDLPELGSLPDDYWAFVTRVFVFRIFLSAVDQKIGLLDGTG